MNATKPGEPHPLMAALDPDWYTLDDPVRSLVVVLRPCGTWFELTQPLWGLTSLTIWQGMAAAMNGCTEPGRHGLTMEQDGEDTTFKDW